MAWTQADIDAMKEAIASGVYSIKHGESTTTYQSLSQMQKALREMQAEVNSVPRRSLAKFSRGF